MSVDNDVSAKLLSTEQRVLDRTSLEDSTPVRVRKLREIYESYFFALTVTNLLNFEEAQQYPKCKQAIQEKLAAMQKNSTWKLTELPLGKKKISIKWIFKTKYKPNGKIQKHKARLLAKGYTQEYGVDYDEVFSPVARMDTIRIFLSLVVYRDCPMFQLDVKLAFLHGEIE